MHSPATTTFVLIRHAAVDPQARLYGWFDVPPSRDGLAALDRLRHRSRAAARPHAMYASPLCRAWSVADTLANAWRMPAAAIPELREIHCGDLEGMPIEEVRTRYPDLWARNLAQRDDDFTWPGGESYVGFRTRVLRALAGLAASHRGQRVAVITHAGVISQVLGVLEGRPAARWDLDRVAPLTATSVLWHDGRPAALLTYNDPDWV